MPYFGNEPAKSAIKVGDNTVLSATIANGVIINEDIKSDAAIAISKTALVAGTGITLATNTLNVDAAQTQITSVGTIGTGVWQGTAVASAYLDADTAHLSTTQTFSGAKTFSADLTLSEDINLAVGKLVNFGDTSGTTDRMLIRKNDDGNGEINVLSNNGLILRTADTTRLTVLADGQVKIAGSVANQQLYVEQDNTSNEAVRIIGPAATSATVAVLNVMTNNGASADTGLKVMQNGAVGIGTDTPGFPLEISNDAAEHLRIRRDGSHYWDIQSGGSGDLYFQKNSATDNFALMATGFAAFTGAADVRLTLGTQGTAGTNSANWIRGSDAILSFNSASGGYAWEIAGTPKMNMDSSGDVTFAGKIGAPGHWELIAVHKLSSDADHITDETCFTSDNYVSFKIVCPWIGMTSASHLIFRFMNGSNQVNGGDYFGGITQTTHASSTIARRNYSNDTEIEIFEDVWDDNASGGCHGEIDVWNVTAPTVDGLDTDRGSGYRGFISSKFVGYDASETDGGAGYGQQNSEGRYNSNNAESYYTGFTLRTNDPSNSDMRAKSHVFVYGLRTA